MPLEVARQLEDKDLSAMSVLDLCSGCGVIGFEFHFYKSEIAELHSLELQRDSYQESYDLNLRLIDRKKTQFFIHWQNYSEIFKKDFDSRYDLIICNPPYFEPDQGKLSPNEFKNRCRFFIDSDFKTLIRSILFALKPGAVAFVLLRPLHEHKRNLFSQLETHCLGQGQVHRVKMIRGTELVRIQKNPL